MVSTRQNWSSSRTISDQVTVGSIVGAKRKSSLAVMSVYAGTALRHELVQLQLLQLRTNSTQIRWRLYAAMAGVTGEVEELLAGCADVKICDIPPTRATDNVEHGYYLNALAELAKRQDTTHICALDPDAFPVTADWFTVCSSYIRRGSALVAILRRENGDRWLSHPSFLFFARSFFTSHRPSFLPGRKAMPENIAVSCWERLVAEQIPDTGYAFAATAAMNGLPWTALLRSNSHNPHYLIGGIYGDIVFHLGGGARTRLVFRGDRARDPMPPDRHAERNRQTLDQVTQELLVKPGGYIQRLRGRYGQADGTCHEAICPSLHNWYGGMPTN